MRGIVRKASSVNGFVAIETDAGEYTIAEPTDGELEPGDEVDGSLDSLGNEILTNARSGERVSVFIQDCHATAARASELLSAP
jgi:hypothetical protein